MRLLGGLVKLVILACFVPNMAFSATIDSDVRLLEELSFCKMRVTSGYRTPEYNKSIGGAPNSYHIHDRARDIQPKDPKCISIKELAKIACFLKMSVIQYTRHLHLDDRTNPICQKGTY